MTNSPKRGIINIGKEADTLPYPPGDRRYNIIQDR